MSGVIDDESTRKLKHHVAAMEKTVKHLEEHIKHSDHADKQVLMSFKADRIKYQGLSNQLEEALKENQQLLNILQQKNGDPDLSRTNSQVDLSPSCSTMSIVHLQYKYEELLSSRQGLLKLLDIKSEEIKKVHEENVKLKTEVEQLRLDLLQNKQKSENLQAKFGRLKERKDEKIRRLKTHKETLQLVHSQLVGALHNQCMEKDRLMCDEIRNCKESERALLLQEIRKNNILAYENFQLNQKIEFLMSAIRHDKLKKKSDSNLST